jgi:hypothetical protein
LAVLRVVVQLPTSRRSRGASLVLVFASKPRCSGV